MSNDVLKSREPWVCLFSVVTGRVSHTLWNPTPCAVTCSNHRVCWWRCAGETASPSVRSLARQDPEERKRANWRRSITIYSRGNPARCRADLPPLRRRARRECTAVSADKVSTKWTGPRACRPLGLNRPPPPALHPPLIVAHHEIDCRPDHASTPSALASVSSCLLSERSR